MRHLPSLEISFFLVIIRNKIEKFICSKWFLNDSKKIGMNTYRFKIRSFPIRGFTLILRNIHKLSNLIRRTWSTLNGRKSGSQVGNDTLKFIDSSGILIYSLINYGFLLLNIFQSYSHLRSILGNLIVDLFI